MDDEFKFKWGTKKGNGVGNKGLQFYNSFTCGGIEYSLYDCVCFYSVGNPETYIGKLVKLFETPSHERKVKVVWFFRPTEIRNYLGKVKPQPHWNELFLASGHGKGLSNFNNAEAVVGKCNVICTSDDKRNPQASEEELRKAHYIFYRTFDVDRTEISEKFPDEIGGTKVEFFFNRRKYQLSQNEPLKIKTRHHHQSFTESSSSELTKGVDIPSKNPSSARRNGSLVKEPEKVAGRATVVEHGCGSSSSDSPKLKCVAVEGGSEPGIQIKDKSRVRTLEMISPENTSHSQPYKKRIIALYEKGPGKNSGENATKTSVKAVPQLAYGKSVSTNNHIVEVTRQPDDDRRSWFKQLPWEDKLQKAQEAGTLVLLENLDPSFSSVEVEDLMWHSFNESVEARMIQFGAFSNSPYAKAFVIFKSKLAAQSAICKLISSHLILTDGRPVIGRPRNLRVSDHEASFAGHLVLDRVKVQRQREEHRNAVAVSTAHCSQTNTFEFNLAMQWRELQEKADLWWKALYERQSKEVNELKSRLKLEQ
ncbi:protein ANTI-SILENCING 1 [Humulus lupulus]|uniref:protein ANTI-SILENCING 1 n=1 Tax=Humulus lupulus TaxID=3486 RepID=UPI002B402E91|nr:protein ANTI-SILENCING 1 [Humulus lupulus]XP_062089790.1 protein ANTI-SILENCING 1 [Humulus lupulus]